MAGKKSSVYNVRKAERDGCKKRERETLVLLLYYYIQKKIYLQYL